MSKQIRRRCAVGRAFQWIVGCVALLAAAVCADAAVQIVGGCGDAHHPPGWSDRSYYLPMRDGVRLAVSIWFPGGHVPSEPVPVVLVQTRYGRAGVFKYGENGQYPRLVRAGYAVVVVDVRGTTSSFGARPVEIGPQEVADSNELIRYFQHRPWSSGQVFATGVSYMADTADIATSLSAGLAGAIVRESDFDAYLDLFAPGGVANDAMMNIWGAGTLPPDYGRSPDAKQGLDCALRAADCLKLWPYLQPVDGDTGCRLLREGIASRSTHWRPDDYRAVEFRDDKARNGYTELSSSPASYLSGMRQERVPVQYWGSWIDAGTTAAVLARYASLSDVPMDVWITANSHANDPLTDPFFPHRSGPLPSLDDQWALMLAFLHRVRAHEPVERMIHYYVLGTGTFLQSTTWPPASSRPVQWRFGPDHSLLPGSRSIPGGEDDYTVDSSATTGKATRWTTQIGIPAAYGDRRSEDDKLLIYTSQPFQRDTELVGNPSVTLYVATTSADPAFFAYFEDVAPDGRVTYLTEGIFRAVNRRPARAQELPYVEAAPAHSYLRKDALQMVPGRMAEVSFPVFPVAALIRRGHRLRVSLAGVDRSAFRVYGGTSDRWRIERTRSEPSGITVDTLAWPPSK